MWKLASGQRDLTFCLLVNRVRWRLCISLTSVISAGRYSLAAGNHRQEHRDKTQAKWRKIIFCVLCTKYLWWRQHIQNKNWNKYLLYLLFTKKVWNTISSLMKSIWQTLYRCSAAWFMYELFCGSRTWEASCIRAASTSASLTERPSRKQKNTLCHAEHWPEIGTICTKWLSAILCRLGMVCTRWGW